MITRHPARSTTSMQPRLAFVSLACHSLCWLLPIAASAQQAYTRYPSANLRAGPSATTIRWWSGSAAGSRWTWSVARNGYGWCDVALPDGLRGWLYASGLDYAADGGRVPLMGYGAAIGIPIVGFAVGNYWGSYYRDRPWYGDRRWWGNSPPPPAYGWARPAYVGPGLAAAARLPARAFVPGVAPGYRPGLRAEPRPRLSGRGMGRGTTRATTTRVTGLAGRPAIAPGPQPRNQAGPPPGFQPGHQPGYRPGRWAAWQCPDPVRVLPDRVGRAISRGFAGPPPGRPSRAVRRCPASAAPLSRRKGSAGQGPAAVVVAAGMAAVVATAVVITGVNRTARSVGLSVCSGADGNRQRPTERLTDITFRRPTSPSPTLPAPAASELQSLTAQPALPASPACTGAIGERPISATSRCAPSPSGRSFDHTTSTYRVEPVAQVLAAIVRPARRSRHAAAPCCAAASPIRVPALIRLSAASALSVRQTCRA